MSAVLDRAEGAQAVCSSEARRDVSASAALRVDPVSSSSDFKAFIELPFRLYAADPHWASPLQSDVREILDEAKNPFWKHARRTLFLARPGGGSPGAEPYRAPRPVRTAGIVRKRIFASRERLQLSM
jgi:hypothetical protein